MKLTFKHNIQFRRKTALFLLLSYLFQTICLVEGYAGGGPGQQETSGFQPVGSNNVVNTFNGDFSYSIPLMEIGNYPLNLSYSSGSGMEQEAGWVGLGWTLSPGSVTRQMRGIPDDFKGDSILKETQMRNNWTASISAQFDVSIAGIPTLSKTLDDLKDSAKLSIGVNLSYNNYSGLSTAISPSIDQGSLSYGVQSSSTGGFGLNYSYNSQSEAKAAKNNSNFSKSTTNSVGFGANAREGVNYLSYSCKSNIDNKNKPKLSGSISSGTSLSFGAGSITPFSPLEYENNSFSFNLKPGAKAFPAHLYVSFTGNYQQRVLTNNYDCGKGFGTLYSHLSNDKDKDLMDYNKEKDVSQSDDELKFLPIPISTYDLFEVNQHNGGGQFRLFRNDVGIFADPYAENTSNAFSAGLDLGVGNVVLGSFNFAYSNTNTYSQKWEDNNQMLKKLDFVGKTDDLKYEPAYFKSTGEIIPSQNESFIFNTIEKNGAIAPNLTKFVDDVEVLNKFTDKKLQNIEAVPEDDLHKPNRELRNTLFTYLPIQDLSLFALDREPKNYSIGNIEFAYKSDVRKNSLPSIIDPSIAKPHHIGEITVLNPDGSRNVFGLPVYNRKQMDYMFNISKDKNPDVFDKVDINFTDEAHPSNIHGIDHFYSKEVTPPYAHSHLLTGYLSSDYQDLTGNGISPDDVGEGVRFNYTKPASCIGYKWRVPFQQNKGNYQENLESVNEDNKASFTYGEKDLVYLHSIESKTMIAVFYSSPRTKDGFAAIDSAGGRDVNIAQHKLDKIVLYSKSELLSKGIAYAIPIKTVNFEYSNELCKNFPNALPGEGKLTLKKVYFSFGANERTLAYEFKYGQGLNNNYDYDSRNMDRWGNYKDHTKNPTNLKYNQFPYTLQKNVYNNKAEQDKWAAAWSLNQIILPSGSSMNIEYETDDYAYVQNKRAMQMFMVDGMSREYNSPVKNKLYDHCLNKICDYNFIRITLPEICANAEEFRRKYLQGEKYIQYRYKVNLNASISEYISGYAEILDMGLVTNNSNQAFIKIKNLNSTKNSNGEWVGGHQPIAYSGIQFFKNNLPRRFYPGATIEEADFESIILNLFSHIGNIAELLMGTMNLAYSYDYASDFVVNQSFVRMYNPDGYKIGGGYRVKKVTIDDNWDNMSQQSGQTSQYGQSYDYTTKDWFGGEYKTISSGVASYEPLLSGEENPFKQPNKVKNELSVFYLEEPFGENLFPGASVGYSKVTTTPFGANDGITKTNLGRTENNFYTAKDFPVITEQTAINGKHFNPPISLGIFSNLFDKSQNFAQGYYVEVNDMHSKSKSEIVYNDKNVPISSTEYFYKKNKNNTLENTVDVLLSNGNVVKKEIGVDRDVYTNMMESNTKYTSVPIEPELAMFFAGIFPIPWGMIFEICGVSNTFFRSAVVTKFTSRKGLIDSIKTIKDGSMVLAVNEYYDVKTGKPLVVHTNTPFKQHEYNTTYPAHWVYPEVDNASNNISVRFNADLLNDKVSGWDEAKMKQYFYPGDEVNFKYLSGDKIERGIKLWVYKNNAGNLRFIDRNGKFVSSYLNNISGEFNIYKSGYRNLIDATVASALTQSNPIANNALKTSLNDVVNVSINDLDQHWRTVKFRGTVGDNRIMNMPLYGLCDELKALCLPRDFSIYILRAIIENDPMMLTTNQSTTLWDVFNKYAGASDCGKVLAGSPEYTQIQTVLSTKKIWLDPIHAGKNFTQLKPADLKYYIEDGCRAVSFDYLNFTQTNASSVQWMNYYLSDIKSNLNTNGLTIAMERKPMDCQLVDGLFDDYTFTSDYCMATRTNQLGIFKNSSCEQAGKYVYAGIKMDVCVKDLIEAFDDNTPKFVNPYLNNMLGNFRPKNGYTFYENRAYTGNANTFYTNGIINKPIKFLTYNNSTGKFDLGTNNNTVVSTITNYDNKGNPVETKNPTGNFTSKKFGYLKTLPIAIAENSQYRNIFFEGFEDGNFRVDPSLDYQAYRISGNYLWSFDLNCLPSAFITTLNAHTGIYSVGIPPTAEAKCRILTANENDNPNFAEVSEGILLNKNNILREFNPEKGKAFILSFWIKRNTACDVPFYNNTSAFIIFDNDSIEYPIADYGGKKVEDWQQVNIPFVTPTRNYQMMAFKFTNTDNGDTLFVDDVRLFPKDANMVSQVHHPENLRHVADLDENNYATFYDYDEAGNLIRIRKETERGIMTIKESRSYQVNYK